MSGVDAGRLNKRVVFQKLSIETDAAGGETELFGSPFSVWADVRYGTGAERRNAAQEQGSQTATFLVRRWAQTEAATVRDRIIHDGAAWDIQSRVPIGNNAAYEFTAVRAS